MRTKIPEPRSLIPDPHYATSVFLSSSGGEMLRCRLNCAILVNMDESIRAELDKLTKLIIAAIPVEQIYLFGSYAYGTPHKYSDLDLYVVLKDDVSMRDLDAGLQIALAISRKKSMPVDIVAKKKMDFESRLNDITLERKVNRDGIRIYG